jgi:hypothetical protein
VDGVCSKNRVRQMLTAKAPTLVAENDTVHLFTQAVVGHLTGDCYINAHRWSLRNVDVRGGCRQTLPLHHL